MEKRKTLFDKPQGPAKRRYSSQGTIRGLTCEGCGTEHPDLDSGDDSRTFLCILGYQIVAECCGAFLDEIFDQFGERFFEIWSNEFESDPLSKEHAITRIAIRDMVAAWQSAAHKAVAESAKVAAALHDV